MKKYFLTIAFRIGVDVLGFPKIHNHCVMKEVAVDGKFFKSYSKK